MSSYVFYVYQAGDIHLTLQAHTLSSDDLAEDWARKILVQRPDAQYVTVKRDDATVGTRYQRVETDISAG